MTRHIEDFMIGRVLQAKKALAHDEKVVIVNGMVMVRKKSWLDELKEKIGI